MSKDIDIDKVICPLKDILQHKDGYAVAKIVDAELDVFECYFEDDCVEINTEDYTHITLSLDNIKTLRRLIHEANKMKS